MRVSSKINLAVFITVLGTVMLALGNLYIVNQQFADLERSERAQNITHLTSSLLALTQEFVLFESPEVAQDWQDNFAELERVIGSTATAALQPQELFDIQSSLAALKPIFQTLMELPADGFSNSDFAQRRKTLIVERLVAETEVIAELGYLWSIQVNREQEENLQQVTVLGAGGLVGFLMVIGMLVVMIRTGVLRPLRKLKETADAIRNGNETAVCDLGTRDELGDVAQAVNQMAHNLAHKNRRLRDANSRAEKASLAKTEFLSNMSHEIRTPLNGIVGLTYLLRDTAVSTNQRVLLESLEKTSRNLIDLVSDVLDISKIEAGSMMLESKPFSMLEFIDKVSGIMTGAATGKSIDLLINPARDLPLELIGDELRFRQIVVNLVGNAIKFTHDGYVRLLLSVVDIKPNTCRLRVEVCDTGVGISKQGQANLFRQFQQGDSSVAREYGGTGLGLSLVKKLVELMNGDLGFSSELQVGSTFWAELEFGLPAASSILARSHADPVLMVSECPLQIESLENMSTLVGRDIKCVTNFSQAKQLVEAGFPVSGVLLDYTVQGFNREIWLDFIRGMGTAGVPCAVMLGTEDSRKVFESGLTEAFSAIYVKPITPHHLQNAFEEQVADPVCIKHANLEPQRKLNLLIVDDSDLNLRVLEGILSRKQANITKANNGLEALSYLMQYGHGFDAVVMDVQMPLMDGLEATRELRRQVFNAELPVIGLSGEVGPDERHVALDAGMNAILHKPLQPEELMHLLATLVKPK